MKKTLLFASLLLGAHTIVNAQNTISFETSQGYTLGTVNGQNGWVVSGGEGDGSENANAVIADDLENYVLKFVGTDSEPDEEIQATTQVSPSANIFSITQRVYASGRDDDNGSDIILATTDTQGSNVLLTSGITFTYEGTIEALQGRTAGANGYYYYEAAGTYEAYTWYEVKTTFNISAGTVNYYVNNELVYEGTLFSGLEVDAITYAFDDFTTSYYIDDISLTTETAGVNMLTAAKFSVFPNPATNAVQVTNVQNATIDNITVSDLNGRTVKATQFSGVTTAQIDVQDLAAGVYLLNITSDKGTAVKKIIKN